ncbi:MAG: Rne/Rng family ribonuclease [Alphaproteobacteria bacterium]|nr:Rne/Rng family ribonuclease [Alphaproteobacteria bacterium]
MSKKMLIDANHIEEKRVVIIDGTKVDELDIESSTKKQIKSNIYLAKVARIEPSLQAAFVDYGGNRHGFLPFNEIHPDYYKIPVADREELTQIVNQEYERVKERDAHEDDNSEQSSENNGGDVETVSLNEADEFSHSHIRLNKRYKIQEVIFPGQVLLVQVVKEERGNKGAALTTYLSLAGRYCVLMPNNARGGGVSRKITSAADRKRLKKVVNKLPLPEDMSVIVRTAGKERTALEIKRDYDYLIKTWVQIRDKTIVSNAPMLIHEEGDIIKRALRDMYTRDIEEILIEGEDNYKVARDFMKVLSPSHAKKVKLYKDEKIPLFIRYQVEAQLEALHSNIVQLKSGAYLVMDQTEALVAIDVNSGRATKEHNIEETALKTNLEAADEIGRQLRLRDMAGIVVVDFIDMEEAKNNHALERRMKEALRKDRARVQMSKITGFGLMEISRQRMHSSFIETSYSVCPHCRGKGMIRSTQSATIHTLHVLQEEAITGQYKELHITVPTDTALYVLNYKRENIAALEKAYNVKICVEADNTMAFPADFRMERVLRSPEEMLALANKEAEEAEAAKKEKVVEEKAPKKRGRKSKKDIETEQENLENQNEELNIEKNEEIFDNEELLNNDENEFEEENNNHHNKKEKFKKKSRKQKFSKKKHHDQTEEFDENSQNEESFSDENSEEEVINADEVFEEGLQKNNYENSNDEENSEEFNENSDEESDDGENHENKHHRGHRDRRFGRNRWRKRFHHHKKHFENNENSENQE